MAHTKEKADLKSPEEVIIERENEVFERVIQKHVKKDNPTERLESDVLNKGLGFDKFDNVNVTETKDTIQITLKKHKSSIVEELESRILHMIKPELKQSAKNYLDMLKDEIRKEAER